MKSRWDDEIATQFEDDLSIRAYTSRLIGSDEDLVLHGGGNTSVKSRITDLFGEEIDVLYVKGSGWDLGDIQPAGFAPVKLETLRKLAQLETLSDTDMVKYQRAAMLDPGAPTPSVEAILHAIIPFKFVDHTHADAVVTLSNTLEGENRIRQLYGDRVLVVPYVMPGFVLARKVAELSRDVDWQSIQGMVLLNHGVFSFADDARQSYERMIQLVQEAESNIHRPSIINLAKKPQESVTDLLALARLRQLVSKAAGNPMIALFDSGPEAVGFSSLENVKQISVQGPLTPDHVIRTKRLPVLIEDDLKDDIANYVNNYQSYFERNTDGSLTCLDPAPRWGIWLNRGTVAFGSSFKEANIVADINRHTIRCIQWGESLGGWKGLPEKDIFEVEYWELEQAKLRKVGDASVLQGRIALVTGAASGIGKACVQELNRLGAAVIALDINPEIVSLFDQADILGLQCDILDSDALKIAVEKGIGAFGGLDIVISNAGMFPPSQSIENMDDHDWSKSLDLNLSSHQRLFKQCIRFLKLGLEPSVVVIGSKNVAAPGPSASAYSAAKAGLNQLARIAALELGSYGIRVNSVHPNAVFDTGIWTEDVLQSRAKSYGLSVKEYKTNNLLKTEVTSPDVAKIVCAMAGPMFSKTTGAQISVDGGNERVI